MQIRYRQFNKSFSHQKLQEEEENKRKITRNQKRRYSGISNTPRSIVDVDALTAALEKEHEEVCAVFFFLH